MPLVAVYLFIITIFATYYGLKYSYYHYPLFIINFSAILASCIALSLSQNIYIVLLVIGMTILAAFLQIILMPGFMRRELRSTTTKALRHLDLVSREIFSCFLQPEYAVNIYLFEKRLHLQKNQFMHTMHKLRAVANLSQTKTNVAKLDELFDILMDCAQLRRRVSDHTVFALCASELSAISSEISELFAAMITAIKTKIDIIDSVPLAEKIKLFDDNFLNILRVTAREPLAFFLFIISLKAFQEATAGF